MKEISPWIAEEMATVNLGHKARDKRLKIVMSQLAAMPAASIPTAVGGGHAETEAAYRFFNNESVKFDVIVAAHAKCTRDRVRQSRVAILTQDTSMLDVTRPEQQVSGAGPLDGGARRGCLIQPLLALNEEGIPLGALSAKCWTREEPSGEALPRDASEGQWKLAPIDENESQHWLTGMRAAHGIAAEAVDTEVIMVADSQSDIFELLVEGQSLPGRAAWIVRAYKDRAVRLENDAEDDAESDVENDAESDGGDDAARSITQSLRSAQYHAKYQVTVHGREPKVHRGKRGRRQTRESRTATVECRACVVTLRAPRRPDRKLPDVTVNAVHVRELSPPKDEEPIEWLLLTSLPIGNSEQVLRVIQTYGKRWSIDVFFKIMKQGLRVERRRFETIDRLKRYLALSLILSWHVFYLSRLGQELPGINCQAVFEVSDWKAVD